MLTYSCCIFLVGFVLCLCSSHGQEIESGGIKSCLKLPDECMLILELGRDTIMENLQKLSLPNPNTTVDIPKRISEVRDFFNLIRQTDCQVQKCICNKGELDCHHLRDDIRSLFQSIKFPTCVLHSPVTARLLDRFKNSVSNGNHGGTLLTLHKLRLVAAFELAQRENEKVINCILQIVEHIRAPIRQAVRYDLQRNCEFCNADN